MKIYTVFGAEGEYSDHQEWAICSYSSEEEAKKHVEKASEQERVIRINIDKDSELNFLYETDKDYKEKRKLIFNKYDPDATTYRDYTGRNYYLVVTDLRDKFNE